MIWNDDLQVSVITSVFDQTKSRNGLNFMIFNFLVHPKLPIFIGTGSKGSQKTPSLLSGMK